MVSSIPQRKIHLFCFQEWERVYFYRQNPENLPVYAKVLSLQNNFSSFKDQVKVLKSSTEYCCGEKKKLQYFEHLPPYFLNSFEKQINMWVQTTSLIKGFKFCSFISVIVFVKGIQAHKIQQNMRVMTQQIRTISFKNNIFIFRTWYLKSE